MMRWLEQDRPARLDGLTLDPLTMGLLSGGGLLQAGGSIASGIIGGNAAEDAAAAMMDASLRSQNFLAGQQNQGLNLLSPFMSSGMQARDFLAAALYGPEAFSSQRAIERARLEQQIKNLESQWGGSMDEGIQRLDKTTAFLTGKNASERRHAMMMEQVQKGKEELQRAQASLSSFDAETGALDRFSGAIREQFTQPMEESPFYQFQLEMGNRNLSRQLASRGLQKSGAGLELLSRFTQSLGAEESLMHYQRQQDQINRLMQLFGSGQQAAVAGGNLLTAFAGPQAAAIQQQGQAQAQGILGRAQATTGMITGVGNAITQGIGSFLNFDMTQQMMNLLQRNQTGIATGPSAPANMAGVATFQPPGSGQFMVNAPA
jgi:hypothetical protein